MTEMATFKVTSTTTVAELKEQFHNEVGGVLRVYQGRSEAPDEATLVSLGAKEDEVECRTSRTVGKFEEAFQTILNLKVKVYTNDNWVKVLDGITLATVNEIPNGATKAKMEKFLGYQRDEKEDMEVAPLAEQYQDNINTNSKKTSTMSEKYDGYTHLDVDVTENYAIAEAIGEYAEANEGDFAVVVKAGDLKMFVEGHLYVNSRGGEGELDNIEVIEGELSEEDEEEIKEEYTNMVSWT